MNNNTDDATPHANNEDNIQLTNQANKGMRFKRFTSVVYCKNNFKSID